MCSHIHMHYITAATTTTTTNYYFRNCSERHSLLNCGAHDHPLVWELGERVRVKVRIWVT